MAMRGTETQANALRHPLEGQVETTTGATPEAVWSKLANLRAHLEWGGSDRPEKMRLLTMEAPAGEATAGTEFSTTGSDPGGSFSDRSVVTEAKPGRVFEFVTEAELTSKKGGRPVEWTVVHRYEIAPASEGARVSYAFRITRISHLVGPLRLLKTPLAFVLRRMWAALVRKGLLSLVAAAEAAQVRD